MNHVKVACWLIRYIICQIVMKYFLMIFCYALYYYISPFFLLLFCEILLKWLVLIFQKWLLRERITIFLQKRIKMFLVTCYDLCYLHEEKENLYFYNSKEINKINYNLYSFIYSKLWIWNREAFNQIRMSISSKQVAFKTYSMKKNSQWNS